MIGGALLIGWFAIRAAQPPVVDVVQLEPQAVSTTLALTGRVEALDRSTVSAPTVARVVRVLVDVGDEVVLGQPLLELDTRDLSAAVLAAQAEVAAARAALEQSRATVQGSEETLKWTSRKVDESFPLQIERDRLNAAVLRLEQERLRAMAALRRVEQGERPEAVRAAEAEVRAARATLATRQSERDRSQKLFEQGAVSRAQLELSQSSLVEAATRLESAEQNLVSLSRGREEDVQQAQAALRAIEAELEGTRRNLATAELNLERRTPGRQELAQSQASLEVSRAAVVSQGARVEAALAQLQLAESRLAQASVVAPFAGKITARMVQPGQSTSPGQSLFELSSPERLRVRLDVDEALLHEVSLGQQAKLTAPALGADTLSGEVSEISRAADPTRGTVEVQVTLSERDPRLLPQMTVDVNLVVANFESALIIPRQAATGDPANATVMVVEGSRVVPRQVQLARADRTHWVTKQGLNEGDLVVVDPETAPKDTNVATRVVPLTRP